MAIQFPNSPIVGQQFTYGDNTWQWSGVTWDIVPGISGVVSSVGISVPTGFVVAGSPVTSTGVMDISFASGYSLPSSASQSNWNTAYNFVNAFPSQTGQSGKFLTTDGSTLSWANGGGTWGSITGTLSNQTDLWNALLGKVDSTTTLTINGVAYDLSANRSWTIDALPSQTGNAGKFLTTDGTVASWATTANIYNSNGTLTGARTVTMASYPLTFSGGTINADRVSIGYLTGDAVLSVQGDSQLWGTANFQSTKGNQISHIHYGTNGNILLRSAATAGVVAMQTAGGNVLIGTETDGTSKLQIRSGSSSTGNALLVQNSTPTDLFTVANTGTSTFSGSITAASAIARGVRLTSTLVAAANNDVLVGLDIAPTFTNGAFTGVSNLGLRVFSNVAFGALGTGLFWDNTNARLGIGTSTPLDGIHLSSGKQIRFTGTFGPSGDLRIIESAGGISLTATNVTSQFRMLPLGNDIYFQNTVQSGNIYFGTNQGTGVLTGNIIFRTSTGVLINTTTNSGYLLDVNGIARIQSKLTVSISDNSFNESILIENSNSGINAIASTLYKVNTVNIGQIFGAPSNYSTTQFQSTFLVGSLGLNKLGIVANSNSSGAAQDIFFSTLGSNTTYQMQIKGSSGNVLIGTNTDSGFRLDVSGNTQITGASSSTGNALTVNNSTPTTLFSVSNAAVISATASNTKIQLGTQANASGTNAVALGGTSGGGGGSTASGAYSFAAGFGTTASGQSSTAIGGFPCSANGQYSIALGGNVAARGYGKLAIAGSAGGQMGYIVAKRTAVTLNSAGTAILFIDNSSLNYTILTGAFDGFMAITVTWYAKVNTVGSGSVSVGDAIMGVDIFHCKSISGVGTISSVNRISTISDASMSSANMTYAYAHSGTSGTLTTTFTAPTTANTTSFYVVAKIASIEYI